VNAAPRHITYHPVKAVWPITAPRSGLYWTPTVQMA